MASDINSKLIVVYQIDHIHGFPIFLLFGHLQSIPFRSNLHHKHIYMCTCAFSCIVAHAMNHVFMLPCTCTLICFTCSSVDVDLKQLVVHVGMF